MGWTRGTLLVATVAAAAGLTGQSAAALASAELDLNALLLGAANAIYDRLEADGLRPQDLSNKEIYEKVVAFHFLAILATHGHFSGGEGERSQEYYDRYQGLSDKYYAEYSKPRVSPGNTPARAGSVFPKARNINTSQF